MKTYTVHQDYIAKENSIIDVIHLDDLGFPLNWLVKLKL